MHAPHTRNGFRAVPILVAILMLLVPTALAQSSDALTQPAAGDWPTYGRDLQMTRYSPLDQITTDNVANLRIAWTRSLATSFQYQGSPVEYDGTIYVNATDRVIALDATNGDLKWEHEFKINQDVLGNLNGQVMRGSVVVYQGDVFTTTADGHVVALDAASGDVVWDQLVADQKNLEGFSAGPIFADGKIVVGPSGADAGGVPGRIIALDPKTGDTLWTFHTVPHPGEKGFDTWDPPSAAQTGGGSAWTPGAYDPSSKTLIYGVGNPIPVGIRDHSGDIVRKGDNLYTDSYVGIDITDGSLKWYHQIVPNDVWDGDEPDTPIVANLNLGGNQKTVAILPLTQGFVVLDNASDGTFLDSYKFMPETTYLTGFDANGKPQIDDSYRYTDINQTKLDCAFRWVDFEPAAFSPDTGLYYRPNTYNCVNMTNHPNPSGWQLGQPAFPYSTEALTDKFDTYGHLSAIDPTTGKEVWSYPTPYAQFMGPVATKGGLVFAGFADRTFRAFDAKTGDVLWHQGLPALIGSNPITYSVDGTQYVAIVDGGTGSGIFGSHQSSAPDAVQGSLSLFVFALPGNGGM